jgi:PAS domain S-box-containing protein
MKNSIKVLLIEDNPADARLIKEMLSGSDDTDFILEVFNRLSKGIEYLKGHRPDVVLLDLMLPDSAGIATFEKLSAHAPYLPVIVLTGIDDEQIAIESLRSGLQDYLVKNKIDGELLTRSIRYSIERKQLEEALRKAKDSLEMRVKERTLELSGANKALHDEIVERKRIEAALRESEERLDYSLNAADLGTWDLDIDSQTAWRSMKHDQIFGYEKRLPKWDLGTMLGHVLPEDREEVERKFLKAVSGHEDWNFECRIRRADGEVRWIWKQGRCKYDEHGNAIRMAGVIKDVTGRKKVEEELKESKALAELYLDLMAHDISNMHQVALSYLGLACESIEGDGKLDGKNKEMIDKPIQTLERSARLIDNVRMLQKLKAGEYKLERIDLGRTLADVVREHSSIPGDNATLNYPAVNGCYVRANPLLKDVFVNIMGNAIKHSNGPAVIGVDVSRVNGNESSYYRVAIEDNGPGIPDDRKDEVFHRFKRGKTKARGTGLGLYIVKALVESYDGSVKVEDRVPGDHTKGCRFLVYLPVMDEENAS